MKKNSSSDEVSLLRQKILELIGQKPGKAELIIASWLDPRGSKKSSSSSAPSTVSNAASLPKKKAS